MTSTNFKRLLRWHCSVCGKPDALGCKRCQLDFYCGPEHQRRDWQRHRSTCGAVAVVDGYLEAARDIPAGTRVIREVPAVIFPRVGAVQGWLMCVGCCSELGHASSVRVPQCPGCGLPRCRPGCDHDNQHEAECAQLQRGGFKLPRGDLKWLESFAWQGLAVLRVFLWAQKKPGVDESLQRNLNGDITSSEPVAGMWAGTRDWLLNQAKVTWLPEEKLLQAFQFVVCFGLANNRGSNACDKSDSVDGGVTGLYLGSARALQSCRPSLFAFGTDPCSAEHVLVTTRLVRRGERLSLDHRDDPLQSAAERRLAASQLRMECACGACDDPSRLGTHLDSLACTACEGLVVPLPLPADAPHGLGAGGRCNKCGRESSAVDMETASMAVLVEWTKLERTLAPTHGPAPWEAFLRRHLRPKGRLHPKHLLALKAKRALVTAVGAVMCRMDREHTLEEMHRWEGVMRELLGVLAVLRPGMNCHRNNVLIPLTQLLLLRAMHLNKEDRPLAVCKAPLFEGQALLDELGRCFDLYQEGVKALQSLRFQESLCIRLLAGESPMDFLADGTITADMMEDSDSD